MRLGICTWCSNYLSKFYNRLFIISEYISFFIEKKNPRASFSIVLLQILRGTYVSNVLFAQLCWCASKDYNFCWIFNTLFKKTLFSEYLSVVRNKGHPKLTRTIPACIRTLLADLIFTSGEEHVWEWPIFIYNSTVPWWIFRAVTV